jgi:hypothetical protein
LQNRGEASKVFSHQETIENLVNDKAALQDYLDKNDLLILDKNGGYFLIDRKSDDVQDISKWKNINNFEGVFSLDNFENAKEVTQNKNLEIFLPSADSNETDRKRRRKR